MLRPLVPVPYSPPRRRTRGSSRRTSRLRRIIPGTTYHVTKKTNDDFFYLRPSEELNFLLLYTLILKVERYGLLLHAFCFMSNHLHLIVTDVQGKLPAFMREFLSESSKIMCFVIKSERRIWSSDRYGAVELLDLDAAERAIAYVILNPTRAGLTQPGDWPGLTSAQYRFGDSISAKRPGVYFSKRYRPEIVSTRLASLPTTLPGQPTGTSERELQTASERRIWKQVRREQKEIRRALKKKKASFAGAQRVLKTSQYKRSIRRRSSMNPRFASKDRERLEAAIASERSFLTAHAEAKERYTAAREDLAFPRGTYGYQVQLGVRVEGGGVAV